MGAIEDFLATRKLYRCEPLSADITPEQCRNNRSRKTDVANNVYDVWACKSCPSPIIGKEDPVSNYKCIVEGCEKYQVIERMCTLHAKERGFTKQTRTEAEKKAIQSEKVRKMNEARKKQAAEARLVVKKTDEVNVKAVCPEPVKAKPVVISHGLAPLTRQDIDDIAGTSEPANHPNHYGGAENPYEAIKVIEAWDLGFHLGNVIKYVSRAGKKGDDLEDLKKAQWYLQREIEKRA